MSRTSHCLAIIVSRSPTSKAPEHEDLCSVAMSVQNMHLAATSLHVGAYWSSASCITDKTERSVTNPSAVREFLELEEGEYCVGWLFLGRYEGEWKKGRRTKEVADYVEWRR